MRNISGQLRAWFDKLENLSAEAQKGYLSGQEAALGLRERWSGVDAEFAKKVPAP